MAGAVESLNVSVASGVCLHEAMRQRLAPRYRLKKRITTSAGCRTPTPTNMRSVIQPNVFEAVSKRGCSGSRPGPGPPARHAAARHDLGRCRAHRMVLDVDQVAGIGLEAVAGVEFGQGVADDQLEIARRGSTRGGPAVTTGFAAGDGTRRRMPRGPRPRTWAGRPRPGDRRKRQALGGAGGSVGIHPRKRDADGRERPRSGRRVLAAGARRRAEDAAMPRMIRAPMPIVERRHAVATRRAPAQSRAAGRSGSRSCRGRRDMVLCSRVWDVESVEVSTLSRPETSAGHDRQTVSEVPGNRSKADSRRSPRQAPRWSRGDSFSCVPRPPALRAA